MKTSKITTYWTGSEAVTICEFLDEIRNAILTSHKTEIEQFWADVFGGRIRYAYSTKVFASAFVQYNAASDELVTNIRFNFIHAPLSDVFLVFTERRDLENSVLLDRVLTAKVTKIFAF